MLYWDKMIFVILELLDLICKNEIIFFKNYIYIKFVELFIIK